MPISTYWALPHPTSLAHSSLPFPGTELYLDQYFLVVCPWAPFSAIVHCWFHRSGGLVASLLTGHRWTRSIPTISWVLQQILLPIRLDVGCVSWKDISALLLSAWGCSDPPPVIQAGRLRQCLGLVSLTILKVFGPQHVRMMTRCLSASVILFAVKQHIFFVIHYGKDPCSGVVYLTVCVIIPILCFFTICRSAIPTSCYISNVF